MATQEWTFTAGSNQIFPGGKQFILLEADAEISLVFRGTGQAVEEQFDGIKAGFQVRFPDRFDDLKITSATAQTIKVLITENANADFELEQSGSVDLTARDTLEGDVCCYIAAGAYTTAVAADPSIKAVILKADTANAGDVRIGTTLTSRGLPLFPGETLVLDPYNGDVMIFNPQLTGCYVWRLYVK